MEPIYKFYFSGRCLVQKNNIKVRYRKIGGKKIPFIGHSPEFSAYRDSLTMSLFEQFESQGGEVPIDFLIEVHYRFYVEKKGMADIDNLPSAFNDAIQGIKTGRKKVDREYQVLTDDKLIAKMICERFVISAPEDGVPRLEVEVFKYGTDKNGRTGKG